MYDNMHTQYLSVVSAAIAVISSQWQLLVQQGQYFNICSLVEQYVINTISRVQ